MDYRRDGEPTPSSCQLCAVMGVESSAILAPTLEQLLFANLAGVVSSIRSTVIVSTVAFGEVLARPAATGRQPVDAQFLIPLHPLTQGGARDATASAGQTAIAYLVIQLHPDQSLFDALMTPFYLEMMFVEGTGETLAVEHPLRRSSGFRASAETPCPYSQPDNQRDAPRCVSRAKAGSSLYSHLMCLSPSVLHRLAAVQRNTRN